MMTTKRDTYQRIILFENIRHLSMIAIIGLVVHGIRMILKFNASDYNLWLDPDGLTRTVWIIASVIYIVIAQGIKSVDSLKAIHQPFFLSVASLSLLFSSLITAVATIEEGNIYVFVINTLVTSAFLSFTAVQFIVVLLPSVLILGYAVSVSSSLHTFQYNSWITILAVLLFSTVVVQIGYQSKMRQLEYLGIIEQQNMELLLLSEMDDLTRIHNRRKIMQLMENIWQISMRESLDFSVLMIDIDYFKKYNDTYGHVAGDHCLKTVAETISKTLKRQTDYVGRFGGEEFIVLLTGTEASSALDLAENIRLRVQELGIVHVASDLGVLTISIGVAHFNTAFTTITALINQADLALYKAKLAGRNQTVLFDPRWSDQ